MDLEIRGVHQAQVSGDHVAVPEEDNVARDQLTGGENALLPLPEDPGGGRPHVSQGFQGGLGFFLLDDADDRVDHHDGSDDNGLGPLLQQGGEQGRADENEDHRVQQLFLQHAENGLGGLCPQRIGSVGLQTFGCLGIPQAVLRGMKGFIDLGEGLGVPRLGFGMIHVGSTTPFVV